jgi:hypothetical protein
MHSFRARVQRKIPGVRWEFPASARDDSARSGLDRVDATKRLPRIAASAAWR